MKVIPVLFNNNMKIMVHFCLYLLDKTLESLVKNSSKKLVATRIFNA